LIRRFSFSESAGFGFSSRRYNFARAPITLSIAEPLIHCLL
jgi:hypothetical protein